MKEYNLGKLIAYATLAGKQIETNCITCNIPYLSSMSKKWYSLAWAGRGGTGCWEAPVAGGPPTCVPPTSWKASMFAKLANTGSEAKASVSEHSSIGCNTCSIFGWRKRSSCLTDPRRISVTVSFLFGLCSFSAQRFSNTNTEHSYKRKCLFKISYI